MIDSEWRGLQLQFMVDGGLYIFVSVQQSDRNVKLLLFHISISISFILQNVKILPYLILFNKKFNINAISMRKFLTILF